MRVILNNVIYGMNEQEGRKLIKVASKHVPLGIYAVEKDEIVELRNDICNSVKELEKLKSEYESKGFVVYFNGLDGEK